MTNAQQTKQARHLIADDVFSRWGRHYTVIANEKGSGGQGRSILATTETGERVIIPVCRATETLELV